MTIRAVVFDLDGTLIDSDGDIARAALGMMRALGRQPVSRDEVRRAIGHGARYLVSTLLDTDDPGLVERGREAFIAHYLKDPVVETRLYPGIEAALQALRNQGRALAVATNKPRILTHAVVEALGLTQLGVGAWASADETPGRKPDPAVLALAVARLGLDPIAPEQVVYVGDMDVDVETAHRFGATPLRVGWGFGGAPDGALMQVDALAEAVRALEEEASSRAARAR